ncbi:MAG: short-chain dehydrogenase [Bermanella sp.]|nr:short-chain dehydrogenase [Bermanella sp.]
MNSIIIGAGSAIAQAVIQSLHANAENIITVSRKLPDQSNPVIHGFTSDYSPTSIAKVIQQIKDLNLGSIDRVYICNGVLQNDNIKVEKRIEDLDPESFMSVLHSNTLTPILWVQALLPILRQQNCTITVFSARIGSISDNNLGGWYSYRASKAALNMLLKNACVEYAKRAKGVKILAFHPGTTDTPLSKPFQKNVPKGKLFSPEFVATSLEEIIQNLEVDGQLSFKDWQSKDILW